MSFLLLAIGLLLIIKSADVLIDSASKIARTYGVSSFIIGITVVAFGTSAPELAVGIMSGLRQANQLTLGNIVGSSMSNLALIVGLSAVIFPLHVKDSVVRRELPILLGAETVLGVLLFTDGQLSRTEGFILLGLFVLFMAYIWKDSKSSLKIQIDAEGDIDTDWDGNGVPPQPAAGQNGTPLTRLWIYAALSLLGLFAGGRVTVDSSTRIAQSFGLSETLIGLTVVALATTMPELITSILAARKKEPDIVLGNCIGSNLFNILLVLGVSSAIHPIGVDPLLRMDLAFILLLTLLVFLISLYRRNLRRATGIFLLMVYAAYLTVKILPVFSGQS